MSWLPPGFVSQGRCDGHSGQGRSLWEGLPRCTVRGLSNTPGLRPPDASGSLPPAPSHEMCPQTLSPLVNLDSREKRCTGEAVVTGGLFYFLPLGGVVGALNP